jgi:L-malate glycosyltransferase
MKILFLNYEYPPLGGGAGNATFYLLREFLKFNDLEIDLVTSSVDNRYHLEKIGAKIKIHRLPIGKNPQNMHFQTQKDLLVYSWKTYWFCRKLIKKEKVDLTLAFFTVPCGFLAGCFKRKFKTPYIVSLRGSDVPGYSERFTLIYNFLTPLIKNIWKKADRVVANSEGLKKLAFETKPNQEIEIIYNGIDIEEFKPVIRSLASDGKVKLLCVSRLTERKGINYLIDAFKIISEEHNNIFLNIIGEGDAKDELVKQAENLSIRDKINFAGRIKHDQLPKIYERADIFVLPSLNEGMSNTILEAIASGLPVVATDTGGTQELIKDGVNGLVVKMKDTNDLAEKIEKLINDRGLRQKMAEESRNLALKFSWKCIAEKYVELFIKI